MRVFRYKLPLISSIRLGSDVVDQREGLLLEENGSWAEAAPLPQFSSESCEDVLDALRGDRPPFPASLAFALDSLGHPLPSQPLAVNALLQGSRDEMLGKAESLSASACPVVKLKVGRHKVREEIDLVRELRSVLRKEQTLRLDANRAWDWSTAIEFSMAVSDLDIEYIEEPLRDPKLLEAFYEETRLPYALDETLLERELLDEFVHAAACVVKPTILGGRDRLRAIADHGKPLVFSACYESGVGLSRIIKLAHEFSPNSPAGLDTYPMLAADVLRQRLVMRHWHIQVPETLDVDLVRLEEIIL